MIFVTIGASEFQFNRMLRWVDRAIQDLALPREKVFFQIGRSDYLPVSGDYTDYLDSRGLEKRIQEADCVICHAGVGTILISLVNGKKPIAIPRMKEYAETVDNHQVIFVKHLAANNLVVYPRNDHDLNIALTVPPTPLAQEAGLTTFDQSRGRLVRYLTDWVK